MESEIEERRRLLVDWILGRQFQVNCLRAQLSIKRRTIDLLSRFLCLSKTTTSSPYVLSDSKEKNPHLVQQVR